MRVSDAMSWDLNHTLTQTVHWANTRRAVTSNENLAFLGTMERLNTCINVNPKNPVEISPKLMATAVEAIIGAVFYDGGLPAVRQVLHKLCLVYRGPWIMVTFIIIPVLLCQTLRINDSLLHTSYQRSLESF